MTRFATTQWTDSRFAQDYRDDAGIYIPFRSYIYSIVLLFYRQYLSSPRNVRVLDLGCGDGRFAHELLLTGHPHELLLIDGSPEMLEAARNRLQAFTNVKYMQASFQELLAGPAAGDKFELVFSSLAIHHLGMEEKVRLFRFIYGHLSPGGYFLHYDVVKPPSDETQQWHLLLWRHWIEEHAGTKKLAELITVPEQYQANPDNRPDTLRDQMDALRRIGFADVDCHFQYGIFALFGGRRPVSP